MRYTPLATDALCPMPYALCPMPARAPHVTEKGYTTKTSIKCTRLLIQKDSSPRLSILADNPCGQQHNFPSLTHQVLQKGRSPPPLWAYRLSAVHER